ncbi:MAG TPA: hypothetical protein VML94_03575 [Thermoplasmata archaeon]|nr:hypothetical protein [Thermoplasmata archaeon]
MSGVPNPTAARGAAVARAVGMPSALWRRLGEWVDIDQVGVGGLWTWLETVLPLLPAAGRTGRPPTSADAAERVKELARDLVDCARERSRLTTISAEYYHDNVALARRVKSLEATLATIGRAGWKVASTSPSEPDAPIERYLPRK